MKYIDEIRKNIDWQRLYTEIGEHMHGSRYEDDSPLGQIIVTIGNDCDAWIGFCPDPDEIRQNSFRFRVKVGGGESLRIRDMLCLVLLAIQAENEDHPQNRRRTHAGQS